MNDHRIPLVVVVTLALGVIIGLAVMGYLATTQTPIPDQFDRLVTFLAGGLAGILATTRSASDPTEVVGPDGGPVPVVDEAGHVNTGLVTAVACVVIAVVILLWAFTGEAPFAS